MQKRQIQLLSLLFAGTIAQSIVAQEPVVRPGAAAPAPAGQGRPRPNNAGRTFLAIGDPPDPAAVERGEKLYVPNCGFCHGSKANGGQSGPDLVRSVLVLHDEKGDKIGPVILNGRVDKGMPKFSMTQAQIADIAAFFLSRSQAAANRMEYKILDVVTGNAAAGKAYFNGKGQCNTCHSSTGDLAGIAKKYEAVALQSRFLYPQTRSRGAAPSGKPSTVTVTLPGGQSFSGTLVSIDDFVVGMRDSSGDYHSWPCDEASGVKVEVHDPLRRHVEMLKQYTDADMHNVLAYLETLK